MIHRSLPSDRRTPIVYVALGDSTVYGLGASSPSTHYVARLFWRLHPEYPSTRHRSAAPGHALGRPQRSSPGADSAGLCRAGAMWEAVWARIPERTRLVARPA